MLKNVIRYIVGTGYDRGLDALRLSMRHVNKLMNIMQRRIEHSQDKPVPTLQRAYETWLIPEMEDKLKRDELRASTHTMYRRYWDCHVKPAFGSLSVSAIKPADIQEWLLGLKKSSANKTLMLLKQVLDKCVMFETIQAIIPLQFPLEYLRQ